MPTFPLSPISNQEYTESGVTYIFTGSKWKQTVREYSLKGELVSVSNTSTQLDLSLGNFFEVEYSSNTTISFSNPPAADETTAFKVLLKSPPIEGYSLSTASYANKFASVTAVSDIAFKPDGTMLYKVDFTGDAVYQYILTTPWDISTATYSNKSFSVATQDISPTGMYFKPDGSAMYIVAITSDTVYQYTLTTPWDIYTATYASKSISVAAQDVTPYDIFIKPDGLSMYMTGLTNDRVYQYTLSTAWDISTATYTNKSFYVGSQETTPLGMTFKPDGSSMYVVGDVQDRVYQYTLATPWDVSTASYSGVSYSVASQVSGPYDVEFKPDGSSMYIAENVSGRIYQYSTDNTLARITWPTNIEWELSLPPILDSNADILVEFYTSDGGITYYAGTPERDMR